MNPRTERPRPIPRAAAALALLAWLAGAAAPVNAGDPAAGSPMIVYQTEGDYAAVRDNLEFAILGQGLIVSGTLHVADMLERTAADLGFPEPAYGAAESLEFCSALLSQRMIQVHPANLAICPFTVSVYTLQAEPGKVFVAYRRPVLAGAGGEVEREILEVLDTIARQAVE